MNDNNEKVISNVNSKGKKERNVPDLRFDEFETLYNKKNFYEIISIVNGQVDPNDEEYRNLPHIGPGNIEKKTGFLLGYNLAYQDKLISSKYLFDKDCVIYGKINPHFAKAAYPGFIGLCSADAYPLKPTHELLPYYLLQLILTKRFTKFTTLISKRTGMPKVNRDDLATYKFYVPILEEQGKVSDFIRLIDQKILTQKKIISDLESLINYTRNKLLDEMDNNSVHIPLSEYLLEFNEKTIENDEYPVLSSTKEGILLQSEYFNKESSSENKTGYKIVPENYCTYRSMSDTGSFTFNKQNVVKKGIISPAYPVFTTNEKMSVDFIIEYMNNSKLFKSSLLEIKEGGTRFALSYSKLLKLSTVDVDLDQQLRYISIIKSILKKIDNEKKLLFLYEKQKQYLLNHLFI